MNQSTVLRAIKAGKVSATRNEHGEWEIDPAEMHRVYPVASTSAEQPDAPAAPHDHLEELLAALRVQLDDMRNERDDMRKERDRARTDADTWRAAFEREHSQRVLPAPRNDTHQPGRWWPWRRAG
jgi:hypothetical protein